MKLIDKDVLVAEIKRRISKYEDYGIGNGIGNVAINAKIIALQSLLIYINHLEMKEVDLEKEVNDYGYHYDYVSLADRKELVDFAKHFFELGLFSQLTWQDIRLISEIGEEFMNSEESDDLWKDEEVYYTAILNKLKEKGRDYKTERQITRELEQKGEEV